MKKSKNKKIINSKGVTLIVLVITIVVLLILAGITIATLNGDNGIINKSLISKEKTEKAGIEEQVDIAIINAEEKRSDATIYDIIEELKKNKVITNDSQVNTNTGVIISDAGYVIEGKLNDYITKLQSVEGVTIPYWPDSQSTIIENSTLETGLTVKDKNNNEWVWIEVPKTIYTDATYTVANGNKNVTSSTDYTGIYNILNKYAYDYREGRLGQGSCGIDEWYDGTGKTASTSTNLNDTTGCGLTSSEYTEKYQNMLSSVFTNGGFWIGRYEAGIEGTTGALIEEDTTITSLIRTNSSNRIDSSSPKAISQKDAIPYNYVYCNEAQMLANDMSSESNRTSSLMFGIQWSLVCKFLEGKDGLTSTDINSNSMTWGNYSESTTTITSANAKQMKCYETWKAITEGSTISSLTLISTGSSNNTKRMNIYDFAGNECELTLEHTIHVPSYHCALMGGSYISSGSYCPASFRYIGSPMGYDHDNHPESGSFRATLY